MSCEVACEVERGGAWKLEQSRGPKKLVSSRLIFSGSFGGTPKQKGPFVKGGYGTVRGKSRLLMSAMITTVAEP